jgi:diacylglycerol kinase family enzyme
MHWFGSLITGSKAVILKGTQARNILSAAAQEKCSIVWLLVPWAQDILNAIDSGEINLDDYDFSAEPLSVSYMSNIGGVGLDARVCEIVNRKKERGRRGKKLYVSALLYCIRHRVPIRAKVICDGQTIFSGRYLSMAFGVGKYSGGGMRQTPEAVLDDGLLDITIIPDIPIWIIAKEVYKLFTGNFLTIKEVIPAKCREVLVLPESEADAEPVEVDGEVVGRAPVRMEVLGQQINIIKPV